MPEWSTACPDWADRLRAGRSIIPPPIFPEQAEAALQVFRQLRIVDAPGSPTFGAACDQWVFDLVASIFGAYDPESGRRLITEWFVLIPKKNAKALALDTPVPTPRGWTTMGELREGDEVLGTDGRPCRVVATSGVFTDHDCYELEFSNGERVVADAGHQWVTYSLKDEAWRARTTEEIASSISSRSDGARNHSLRMPEALDLPEADLPVAPYTLGAWLGDGTSAAAQITFDPADVEIARGIQSDGWPLREKVRKGRAVTFAISSGDRSQEVRNNGLAAKLRALGVLGNKHIPAAYLRASFAQRLALLQGLMDTDGTVSKNGRCLVFTTTNPRLARGFEELLATFGVKFSSRTRRMTCSGRPVDGIAHCVQFMAFRDELPVFRLARKLVRMRTSGRLRRRSRTVQVVAARKVPSVPVKCISVDSADRQFLFGRTMLPTHNSTIAAGIMMTALILNWRQSAEFAILAPTIEVANNAFAPARDIARRDEDLDALMHVQTHVKTITHRESGAMLKVVAADNNTVGGKKSVGTLVDELWLFGKRVDAENMLREAVGGLASRPEGFVIYLTTQSDDPPAGVFRQKLQYARDVRDGKVVDPRFVPVIYEFPRDMIERREHLDPANFRMVNPNLGYSVDREFLEREFQKASNDGEESLRGFLAKHLNVEVGLALRSDRWAGADFWERQAREGLTLEQVIARSEVIDVGIDGGGLDDLLGLAVLGRDRATGEKLVWTHAWAHPSVLERRKSEAERFADFERDGDLTLVEQIGQDVDEVAEIVAEIERAGLLDRVGVDPAGLGGVLDALEAAGVPKEKVVGISQGWKLSGSIKTAERWLAGGELVHGGRPLMAWCVGNAKVVPVGNAVNITKQASGVAKIDPLMAMFNAVSLMALNPAGQGRSFWDTAA